MDNLKRVQLRIKKKAIIAEGCGGTIFWATEQRAKLLLDAGAVDLVNAPEYQRRAAPGPTENKILQENNDPKKSSDGDQVGPLTGSAPSDQSGKEAQSSASAEAPASIETSSLLSSSSARRRRSPGS